MLSDIQVSSLSNVEAKKRFEFLEAISGTMDAHLQFFKKVLYDYVLRTHLLLPSDE